MVLQGCEIAANKLISLCKVRYDLLFTWLFHFGKAITGVVGQVYYDPEKYNL
jgi:hypothetical protein